ncbi:MAG TPA: transcription antitermination factor NusB [Rhizomicrobium sp.]|jgi:16S rRNA (cytosine967-C5)-methyltransferase
MTNAGLPARIAAQDILSEVLRRRRPLDMALDTILSAAKLDPRDAGFARAIAGETLRRFGQIDALLRHFIPKPPAPHRSGPTLEILLAGACELLFLDVAAHAAVDAANRLAARDKRAMHFKPLINAALRRIAREGREALAQQDAHLAAPDWLWERWRETYGETTARAIVEAHLKRPPVDLALKEAFAIPGAETLPNGMLRLADPGKIEDLPGFAEGKWWVQDFAASLPVNLLGDVRGATVLDLCAAPGGKTAQLAAKGAKVIAVERVASRLQRLRENLARLSLDATLIESDARDYRPEAQAPFVLLDAPCSATGTIRRHPDLPWIKSAADINLCASGAGELLDAAAEMVAPGGILVFAVCSLEPEEGLEQIAAFLDMRKAFTRKPLAGSDVFGMREALTPDGDLRTLPSMNMDGFYAARLKREA